MRADLKRIRSGTFASMRVPPDAAIPQSLEAPAVNDSTSTVGNTFGNNAAAGTGVVDLRRPPRPMTPHLNAVSWILMAWGWFRALWGLAGWLVDSLFDVVPGFFLNAGPWPILSGLGILLTGYYLKRRSRRARFAAFILAFFLIGLPPFGWALAGYMGWVLLSANGRRMFPPNSPPAAV